MSDLPAVGKHHLVARDFVIPILIGIVGVAGSLGGVYIANANAAKQAEVQKTIEFESKWFDQRLQLIDRTANIFGKSPGLQDVWVQYLEELAAKARGKSKNVPPEVLEKITEAQGEFQSVIMLIPLYFGPKSTAALQGLSDIKGPWWMKPREKRDALLVAMSQEVTYGLKSLSLKVGQDTKR